MRAAKMREGHSQGLARGSTSAHDRESEVPTRRGRPGMRSEERGCRAVDGVYWEMEQARRGGTEGAHGGEAPWEEMCLLEGRE